MSAVPVPHSAQLNLDFDGAALADTTFCVVDLETTGGSPTDGRITEIGAVKVRAGEVDLAIGGGVESMSRAPFAASTSSIAFTSA